MQKSVFWMLFLLLVWGFPSMACAQFYRLSLENGKAYLLEIVPGAEKHLKSNPIFQEQFQKANLLFIENHPDSLAYQYQRLYTERGFYAADDHLQNHLSKTTFAALETRLQELGTPGFGHHPRMKPWLLAETLQRLEFQKAGLDPNQTLHYFINAAKKNNREINLLENFSRELDMRSSLSDTKQIQYLENFLKQSNLRVNMLKNMPPYYDEEALEKYQYQTRQEYQELPESFRLHKAREIRQWIEIIENEVDKGETPLLIINPLSFYQIPELLQKLSEKSIKIESVDF